MAESVDWNDLKSSWGDYQKAVDGWLTTAADPASEHAVVDELIHTLIHAHNAWSEKLGAVVEATHHH
ncbi:MAG: hypothetical protein GEU71_10840 [Actinobacteria bacterium]|jgi:hypothetical protein|nr:hypothetical protein [Actinomycetota bacterium]